jgi:hypothetical protein
MLKSLKPQLLLKIKIKKKFLLPILSYHYAIMPLEFSVISLMTIHILPLINGRKTVSNIVTFFEDIKWLKCIITPWGLAQLQTDPLGF